MLRFRLALLCFVLGSFGCGTDRGHMISNSTIIDGSRDFDLVQTTVVARITVDRRLCVFAVKNRYPYAELMKKLHEQYPLRRNEAFVNLREDRSERQTLSCQETYTLTADVVRFAPTPATARPRVEREAPARPRVERETPARQPAENRVWGE